jgi:hypothetical protein
MARDMGDARLVYVLKMGQATSRKSLVPIFDPAPPDAIATVEEQDDYYERWLSSIGIGS